MKLFIIHHSNFPDVDRWRHRQSHRSSESQKEVSSKWPVRHDSAWGLCQWCTEVGRTGEGEGGGGGGGGKGVRGVGVVIKKARQWGRYWSSSCYVVRVFSLRYLSSFCRLRIQERHSQRAKTRKVLRIDCFIVTGHRSAYIFNIPQLGDR